jgi:hypothetical protein
MDLAAFSVHRRHFGERVVEAIGSGGTEAIHIAIIPWAYVVFRRGFRLWCGI